VAENKTKAAQVAIDPEAQKYIRECTKDYVAEMIGVLVSIARNEKTGARDRMKSACKVIEYHSRGTAIADEVEDGKGTTVVVVNTGDSRAHDEAVDELRRLQKATQTNRS